MASSEADAVDRHSAKALRVLKKIDGVPVSVNDDHSVLHRTNLLGEGGFSYHGLTELS
jgi:hypothetical protein